MANRNLGYDVDVDYTGAPAAQSAISDLDRFNTELDNVDHAAREVTDTTSSMFKKATSSWTEFKSAMDVVSQGFTKVQQAAQKAWDTMERGAELDRISGQAESLAADIGASWNTLLADMTDATGGMITQADLTASAVDIIGLGMAGSSDEVIRLSRLVGELGWDMQTLTLTLANQSKARLDSLGLSVGDVTKRVEKFKDAGVEAEQAFKLAVLEAGEERLNLLGSAADTAAGDLKKLEATWGDLMDEIAKKASTASAPLAQIALYELAIAEAIEKGIISQKDMSQAQSRAIFTNQTMAESLGELVGEIEAFEQTESDTVSYYRIINEQRLEAIEIIKAEESALRDARSVERRDESQGYAAAALDSAVERQDKVLDGYRSLKRAAEDAEAAHVGFATIASEAWEEYVAQIQAISGDVFTGYAFDPDQTYDQAEATYRWADAAGLGAEALADLAVSQGLLSREAADYGENVAQSEAIIKAISESMEAGLITADQYENAITAAFTALEQGPTQVIEYDVSSGIDRAEKAFEESGAGIGGGFTTAVQDAVNIASGIVEGFTEPDEVYEAIMELDISAVETGTRDAIDLLNDIEDKIVTVSFVTQGYDDMQDKLDELQ